MKITRELIEAAMRLEIAEEAFFNKPNYNKRREEGEALDLARKAALDACRALARAQRGG